MSILTINVAMARELKTIKEHTFNMESMLQEYVDANKTDCEEYYALADTINKQKIRIANYESKIDKELLIKNNYNPATGQPC